MKETYNANCELHSYNDQPAKDTIVSLPCIFGKHIWVNTGNEIKIWSDTKTDSESPEDCYTQKEQKCLLCGQMKMMDVL